MEDTVVDEEQQLEVEYLQEGDLFAAADTNAKKRFRFKSDHDLQLLQQALEDEPFLAPKGKADECWAAVATTMIQNMQIPDSVTGRALRERFNTLVKFYKADERKKLKSSGTEEDLTMKHTVLANIVELMNSCAVHKESQRKTAEADREIGKQIQYDALQFFKEKRMTASSADLSLDDDSSIVTLKPKRHKNIDHDLVNALHSKEKNRADEINVERERLKLEEQKLELEKQRLALEAEKCKVEKMRVEADIKEREDQRKMQSDMFNAQIQFMLQLGNRLLNQSK